MATQSIGQMYCGRAFGKKWNAAWSQAISTVFADLPVIPANHPQADFDLRLAKAFWLAADSLGGVPDRVADLCDVPERPGVKTKKTHRNGLAKSLAKNEPATESRALSAQVKKIVDEETRKFLDELPRFLRNRLTTASLAILGLDQRWGNDNIKLSEDGSAFFSSLLTEEVKQQCCKLVPGITKRALELFTTRTNKTRANLDDLVSHLADNYYYKLKQVVERQLEGLAEKHGKIICENIEKHFTVEVLKNLDLDDPTSFEGKLGEFALEAIAKDIAGGENKLVKHLDKQ